MGIVVWAKRALNLLTATNVWTGPNTFQTATLAQQTTSNGAIVTFGWVTELLTINTGGTTTDTVIDLPANSIIESVVGRVTTALTVATSFDVGDPTTTSRFATGIAVALNTTFVGLNHWKGSVSTDAAGPTQGSTAKVRITANGGTPGAGVVRLTVFYRTLTPPTS